MRFGLRLILVVAALGLLSYFLFRTRAPQSGSVPENAVAETEESNPTPLTKDASSSINRVSTGDVVAEQYGAVICPDSRAKEAVDAAVIQTVANSGPGSKPDLAAIYRATAKPNGCDYIRPGTSLRSEGEAAGSTDSQPLATVAATMSDGTVVRGVTAANMLFSIPKGNVVAADMGAIICPDSQAITACIQKCVRSVERQQ